MTWRAAMTRIKPWHVLGAGWLLFVLYAYPGLMTRDSHDQLIEARIGELSDAHPPMMQAIWSVIDPILAGPLGMVLLQTATFVAGGYLIVRRALGPRGAALAAIGLLWFPPVGAVMAVVWKDCLMAGLLMLGIAMLLDERRWVRLAALAVLAVATATRYNAFGATLPIIVLLFGWRESLTGLRRHALALGVWLATTVTAFGANSLLTDKPTHFWHASLGLFDIVGTLAYTPTDIEDRELRRAFEGTPLVIQEGIHQHVREHYKPDDHLWTVLPPNAMWTMSLVETAPEDQRDAVEAAWKTIVKGHPIAYLGHRLAVFGAVLGLAGESWNTRLVVTHAYQNAAELRELGVPTGVSTFQEIVGEIYVWCSETFLFRPFIYAAIGLALIVLARRQRDLLAILLSGQLVELSLFFIGPSSDYRYSHWLVVTTCIAIVMLIARRYRDGEVARRSPSSAVAANGDDALAITS